MNKIKEVLLKGLEVLGSYTAHATFTLCSVMHLGVNAVVFHKEPTNFSVFITLLIAMQFYTRKIQSNK